jgi:lysyl-tRNA synthetase, class II
MVQKRLQQLRAQRLEKVKKLRQLGIDPYPHKFNKKHTCGQAVESLGKKVQTAARIVALRGHGRIMFADICDSSGKIQLWFQEKSLGKEKFKLLKLFDVGDFIGVEGIVIKTKTGETTIDVSDFSMLSKSLRPLPAKWHGLKDVENRYRKRYLDLLMNPEVKKTFEMRSLIIAEIRNFLRDNGFLEVETPTLQPLYGGASAKPFVTHHNALSNDFYLKISDELYLKRLIIGGFEKVFEIDHNFRNEGIDKTHNPEFTMMECYWAYADYKDIMKLTEDLFAYVAKKVLGTTKIVFAGHKIDLKPPWQRLTMSQAIKKYLGWDLEKISDDQIKKKLKEKKIDLVGGYCRGLAIAALFEQVEPKLIQPVFITDMPKETTMLCKLHRENPELIERFEPYIAGWEAGNAYSELNDPDLQREFFKTELKQKKAGDKETHPMDEDFIESLEYGMPPTGGLGIGIDRMVMLLTGEENIRDVILFPTLKSKNKKHGQE